MLFVSDSPLLPVPNAFTFLSSMRGKPRRGMLRRAVFSDMQRKGLEKMFQKQKYISKPDRKKLAAKLGLKDSQVLISYCMQNLFPETLPYIYIYQVINLSPTIICFLIKSKFNVKC